VIRPHVTPAIPPTASAIDAVPGLARGDRKKDAIRDFVLERLLNGQYRFGDKILVKEIAEQTGASRQPIMAALAGLRADGFVHITAQVGCEVIAPSMREIGDFFLMFGRLEGLLAELAAVRRQAADVVTLRSVNAQILALSSRKQDSATRYRDLNHRFHGMIYTAARSPMLHARQVVNWAMSDVLICQTCGFLPNLKGAGQQHAAIIDAIEAGAAEPARRAGEAHIQAVARLVARS
jgi:DNA-binding GntR family transcriptional regulator